MTDALSVGALCPEPGTKVRGSVRVGLGGLGRVEV